MGRILFFMLLFVGTTGMAHAALVNFDSFSDGQNIDGINLGGVTITASDGIVNVHANGSGGVGQVSNPNSIAASSWSGGMKLTLTFDSLVNFVSIVGGDSGGDQDRFTMEAFDISGTSIGFADTGVFSGADPVTPLTTTYGDYRTLSLNVSGAKSVVLEQTNWGVSWDNLQYNPVPVPGALWLLGSGLAGLVAMRRKRDI